MDEDGHCMLCRAFWPDYRLRQSGASAADRGSLGAAGADCERRGESATARAPSALNAAADGESWRNHPRRLLGLFVFSGDAKAGPYADPATFLPGDWLYYVNHSYGDIEHSGVFVDWTDYARSEGLVLSYAGEQRNEPGRYKVYDLSHVYRITRAQ